MARMRSQEEQWARLGAQARVIQIRQELAAIYKRYPDMRRTTGTSVSWRPRRHISPAARKAMSEGMRRFWARRKAAQKAGAGKSGKS